MASYVAGTQPDKVRALVAIFPACVLQDDVRKRTESLPELPGEENIMGVAIGKIYAEDALSFDIYEVIKNYPGPALLIHGTADQLVPIEYSRRAVRCSPLRSWWRLKAQATASLARTRNGPSVCRWSL